MQSQYQKVMIFSAELSTNSFEKNTQLTVNLTSDLLTMQVSFNHALGCYKGTKEVSFIALPKNLRLRSYDHLISGMHNIQPAGQMWLTEAFNLARIARGFVLLPCFDER